MNKEETVKYYFCYSGLFFIIGVLFFRNIFIAVIASFLARPYKKEYLKKCKQKSTEELREQFHDFLYSVSASIGAGRQMENAIYDARKNLELIYSEDALIMVELDKILKGMTESNLSCADLLKDFSERNDIEEIKDFYDVYMTCRSTGADMNKAILKTCNIMVSRKELRREMQTALAQKKYESNFLIWLPVIILALLNITVPDYLEPLYVTIRGRIVMVTALLGMCLSRYIVRRILKIEI